METHFALHLLGEPHFHSHKMGKLQHFDTICRRGHFGAERFRTEIFIPSTGSVPIKFCPRETGRRTRNCGSGPVPCRNLAARGTPGLMASVPAQSLHAVISPPWEPVRPMGSVPAPSLPACGANTEGMEARRHGGNERSADTTLYSKSAGRSMLRSPPLLLVPKGKSGHPDGR